MDKWDGQNSEIPTGRVFSRSCTSSTIRPVERRRGNLESLSSLVILNICSSSFLFSHKYKATNTPPPAPRYRCQMISWNPSTLNPRFLCNTHGVDDFKILSHPRESFYAIPFKSSWNHNQHYDHMHLGDYTQKHDIYKGKSIKKSCLIILILNSKNLIAINLCESNIRISLRFFRKVMLHTPLFHYLVLHIP